MNTVVSTNAKRLSKLFEEMAQQFDKANGDFDAIQKLRTRYAKKLSRHIHRLSALKLNGKEGEAKLLLECGVRVMAQAIWALTPEDQQRLVVKANDLFRQANEVNRNGK